MIQSDNTLSFDPQLNSLDPGQIIAANCLDQDQIIVNLYNKFTQAGKNVNYYTNFTFFPIQRYKL